MLSQADIRQIRICIKFRMDYWTGMIKGQNDAIATNAIVANLVKLNNLEKKLKTMSSKNLDNLSIKLIERQ